MTEAKLITLVVLTPRAKILEKAVTKVTLPATAGRFMVLYNHAPVITSLEEGRIVYESNGVEDQLYIMSGFAEVLDNTVTVCAEVEP